MPRLLLYFLLLFYIPVVAQITVSPLHYNSIQAEYSQQRSRMKTAAIDNDTLDIPFWEDFRNSSVVPNDTFWLPGGGTFINNTYPFLQPNYNVATFDGLNANGVPYNKSDIFAAGPTDTLTSRPINLSSAATLNKPVYFRFFWQAGGVGEIPDQISDSLILQFKNNTGNWKTVWNKINIPETDDSIFNFQLLNITDAEYLYKGFQFRFRSTGKQSGNYDVWNIDYIMLDTGVIAQADWAPEFAYRSTSPSLLKKYTSMPVWQYEADIAGETRDELDFEVVNLRKGVFAYEINPAYSYIKDLNSPTPLIQNFPAQAPVEFNGRETKTFSYPIDKTQIPADGQLKIIEYRSTIKQSIDPRIGSLFDFNITNDKESDIDYAKNDTIKGSTIIDNYYSYDDGSAEAGIGVNQSLGKIAAKYKVNVKDTLKSISICFPDVGKDFKGTGITVIVWTGIQAGQTTANVLYYKTFTLQHGTSLNGFHEFLIDKLVVIPANTEFFVGYQQTVDELIQVGFDRNIDNRDKIYYYIKGSWQQYDQEFGSIMIRPEFRKSLITGTTRPNKSTIEANVYPNPNQGEFTIEGKIRTATVYDLTGKQVYSTTFEDEDLFVAHPIILNNLANGLYLLHLENTTGSVVKKIYINK